MKTLQQVEPRGDVNLLPGDASAEHIISQPGSYFLSADIVASQVKDGILITSNDVSLDLRGFRLDGTTKGLTGIKIFGGSQSLLKRCTVRNGIVTGWKNDGITATLASQCMFRDLILSANMGAGLQAVGALITNCVGGDNGGSVIVAQGSTISDCVCESPTTGGAAAIDATESKVSHCTIPNPGFGTLGLKLISSTATECVIAHCTTGLDATKSLVTSCHLSHYGFGIHASESQIRSNFLTTGQVVATGIQAESDCAITDNMLESNRIGISILGTLCRIERNHVSMAGFLAPDGVGIKAADIDPGSNILILNNVTGRSVGFGVEIQVDGDDYAPGGGIGAPADRNYFQPK